MTFLKLIEKIQNREIKEETKFKIKENVYTWIYKNGDLIMEIKDDEGLTYCPLTELYTLEELSYMKFEQIEYKIGNLELSNENKIILWESDNFGNNTKTIGEFITNSDDDVHLLINSNYFKYDVDNNDFDKLVKIGFRLLEKK